MTVHTGTSTDLKSQMQAITECSFRVITTVIEMHDIQRTIRIPVLQLSRYNTSACVLLRSGLANNLDSKTAPPRITAMTQLWKMQTGLLQSSPAAREMYLTAVCPTTTPMTAGICIAKTETGPIRCCNYQKLLWRSATALQRSAEGYGKCDGNGFKLGGGGVGYCAILLRTASLSRTSTAALLTTTTPNSAR